ncbi:MAG: anthranilate synthase component I [Pirellulales bacterium]|nr:anthranilate synthase component I [Pirellulales bacterium]
MHRPSVEEYRRLATPGVRVPVYRRLVSDALTPVTAFRRLRGEADSTSWSALFESVIGGEKVGRYSFLTTNPFLEFTATGTQVQVKRTGKGTEEFAADDPIKVLQQLVTSVTVADLPELPPFCGGAVGYSGYDAVRYVESLPNAPEDDRRLPDMAFALYDTMVVFDNVNKTMIVIVLTEPTGEATNSADAYGAACQRIDEIVTRLQTPEPPLPPADIATAGPLTKSYESNFSRDEFESAVERCKEYIRAGDIFQVVLSQRLQTHLDAPAFEVYRTLRVVNPSPFMFYLRTPQATLVGSSPEILVRVVDRQIITRPLAGTRPRGSNDEEDRRLAEELLADPKERAEHVMLVDLGRNDVGKVAAYGSVKLADVMTVERYSHVMHITSNVSATLASERDAFDALRACLPAGTVSGAPKVRAMEIIDELEPHRRGPYAGAVGYLDFSGNMDTCITLRTLVVQDGTAYIQAGAGIVADSIPANEYDETLNKARGLLKAIELTEQRLHGNS